MKNKFLFLMAVLIFNSSLLIFNCFGQWVQMSSGMGTNKMVWSLAVIGNNMFAGTDNYGIYLSTNGGYNWTQTSLNNQNINALAVSGNNIFAGTGDSGVYLSTNNGLNWIITALNNKLIFSLAITGNNIFAGTYASGVYLSTNNGQNWTQTSLNNKIIYSLGIKENYIYAGTYENNGVYISTNNGGNWTQSMYSQSVYDFAFKDSNVFAGAGYGVFKSTNNGTSWTQTSLNNVNVTSFELSDSNIFAGTFYNGVYLTANNGANWVQKNQGLPVGITTGALLILNNYIYAGTNQSVWRRPLSDILSGTNNISSLIPNAFSLKQNYPNPFNQLTVINYQIPINSHVTLEVYDLLSREVASLVNEILQPGIYETRFDGSRLASGIYFYKLTAGEFTETRRMVLMK
jgi:hypothetical protein